jgi:beta-lactamase regulating signal transducer with metallopeptidase domain
MRRWPSVPAWTAVAVLAPIGILGAISWSAGGTSAWIILHACARAVATAASVPTVLAMALAASIWGMVIWHLCRQALVGRRTIRLARQHAVVPPRAVADAARDLGIRRLIVPDLSERLAFSAGLLRPTVVVSSALIDSLDPAPLEAVLAHEAAHARHRDPLRQVLAHAVGRGLWIVPAARRTAELERLRYELAADECARAWAGRRPLAEALLAFHSTPEPAGAPAIAGGGTALGARIDALVPGARPPRPILEPSVVRRSIIGSTLAALLVVVVVAGPGMNADAIAPMPMNGADLADMAIAWGLRGVVVAVGWIGVRRWLRALDR